MSAQSKKGRRRTPAHVRSWDLLPTRINGRKGWRLRQRSFGRRSSSRQSDMADVAQVAGWRADVILPVLVDSVRRSGHEPSSISARERPFNLSETDGYRLALAFRLSRRSDSPRQVERMVRAVRQFEEEEAYLWYSYLLRAGRNGAEAKLAMALASLGEAIG